MRYAISLYKGELLDANASNYETSREMGAICPFCKESVFLVGAHIRINKTKVAASWHHYKLSVKSHDCELRSTTITRALLKEFSQTRRNQRLKLFNRRFWEIFSYDKDIDKNLEKTCLRYIPKKKLEELIAHCHRLWDAPAIKDNIHGRIKALYNKEAIQKSIDIQFQKGLIVDDEVKEELLNVFGSSNFSVVRLRILNEVVDWMATKTAMHSFEKLTMLALLDTVEAIQPPYHTNTIANMAVNLLVVTDWEAAIQQISSPTKGIGFG